MPNLWAHIQFGRELAEAMPLPYLKDPALRKAFQLGCQGPDFLFYDRFLPWQRSHTAANRLGSLMHNVACGPFLNDLFDAARKSSGEKETEAYAAGFLLHHVLDRHVHPYIFSLSGFRKWKHQQFETALDSAVMWRRAGIHTGNTPVSKEIDTGGTLPGGMADILHALSCKHYPGLASELTVDMLNASVRQFFAAQRLFFDPSGWKGRLTFGMLAPFSPPRTIPPWDVLNARRSGWIDPVDRTRIRQESVFELWDAALVDGKHTLGAGLRWLGARSDGEAEEEKAGFLSLVGNVSYETGLPCGSAWITFAEPVV
ncbi:zinc dependent phospholipase C family protein [Cohnella hashimotonis]|uniref:Zinc dependent phospholipase C family protein n=1 Tax=Cohnella hashimotonis TaxID=2826895 RepID=A0ABT6TCR3_9BACL|nr:zinc dependent phospholipase C family protein [Cohnella hashimotonis]MDI4644371.1 zinc dependent phospholipase C family protein [Cohnella hashimotonis]